MKVDYQMQYYEVTTNKRQQTATNMKINMHILRILVKNDEIWQSESDFDYDQSDLTKIQFLKITMADRCYSENIVLYHNSVRFSENSKGQTNVILKILLLLYFCEI